MTQSLWLAADWPAPAGVRAGVSLRYGGSSAAPWATLNLGDHVGDDPTAVARNRAELARQLALPDDPLWLQQVHGTSVWPGAARPARPPEADAAVAAAGEAVLAILSADCLPVVLCSRDGAVLGAAHAGWRGLAAGVLEATVAAMRRPGEELLAWLGPAIGPADFEVGPEVRAAFVAADSNAGRYFSKSADRYFADLYALATQRLARAGVTRVYGDHGLSTVADRERFFSYRRDGQTGRMATLIWANPPVGHH